MLRLVFILLLIAEHACASACRFRPDQRPLEERLAQSHTAFVGIVLTASDETTTFAVEHTVRGSVGAQYTLSRDRPLTSCDIRFWPGDRWIFAGGTLMSPSIHLGPGRLATPDAIGIARRVDDRALELPSDWQNCTSDAQCVVLPRPCSAAAVTSDRVATASAAVGQMTHLGTVPACQPPIHAGTRRLFSPWCVAGRCGQWELYPLVPQILMEPLPLPAPPRR